jgi:hypothetical protein
MRLTVWHKGTDKPVRDGVYQRMYVSPIFCKFANGHWYCGWHLIEDAQSECYHSLNQIMDWRGIVKD